MSAVTIVNGHDRQFTRHQYVLWFGACAPARLMVWADSLDDALEECASWLAKNAPGHIMADWSDEHKDLIREVCDERGIAFPDGFEALDDDTKWNVCEQAEADLTRTESGFLTSYEWGIDLEDWDRDEIKTFLAEVSRY